MGRMGEGGCDVWEQVCGVGEGVEGGWGVWGREGVMCGGRGGKV